MFENLRRIRTDQHIPAKKMAELLGLDTEAAYYKKENGSVKITLAEGKQIADFLGMSIEEVFFANELS